MIDTSFFLRRDTSANLWSPQPLADPGSVSLLYFNNGTAPSSPISYATIGSGLALTGATLSCTVTASSGANPSANVGLTAVNGSATTFMRSDAAPPIDLTIAPTWTGVHTHSQSLAANTVGDATLLVNPLAATAANQRYSPALHFKGFGWKTGGGGASQAAEWRIYCKPIQGATGITSTLQIDQSVAGGAFGNLVSLDQTGLLTVPTLTVLNNLTTSAFTVANIASTVGGSLNGITMDDGSGNMEIDFSGKLSLIAFGSLGASYVYTSQLAIGDGTGTPASTSLLNLKALPTSAAGLHSGDVWNSTGVLHIVP